ncbi:hypothetical protein A2368_01550 [Candidatus Collierbacteria bacterium RIFOXYB1_FULL_49_13]|uniref:Uncharacterized protein n=1 Tax=Candidatus Collierbacteria bacterium RIFOXYB1_FULL_49_13 TaxID=1817728 RepID=A0A1F5FGZ4_9BACT|nr:MAG: hypothetical protein A2368_01550 [Candidatus Collierbacteria bacterium RIFOXYB1_FULL_49_13]
MKKHIFIILFILLFTSPVYADTVPRDLWYDTSTWNTPQMNSPIYDLWMLETGLYWDLANTRPRLHSNDIVDREIKHNDIDTRTIVAENLADTLNLADTYLARNRFFPYCYDIQYDSPEFDTDIIYSYLQVGYKTMKGNGFNNIEGVVTFRNAYDDTPVFVFTTVAGFDADSSVKGYSTNGVLSQYWIAPVCYVTNTGFRFQLLKTDIAGTFDASKYYFMTWWAIGRRDP